jgi:protein-tyrosine phosphatase
MSKSSKSKKQVLFVCTGNYYRSRFAEIFFNDLVSKADVKWNAISRGLATQDSSNVGPISKYTLERLKMLDIPLDDPSRFPIQLEEKDLLEADLVIALDRDEHLPLMKERFLSWADRIIYWEVPDLHITAAEDALSRVEKNVHALIDKVRSSP